MFFAKLNGREPARLFVSALAFLLFTQAYAQDANCDFSQNATPGVTYQINSPADLSTGSYAPGRQCRWQLLAPANYVLRVDCTLEMPQTSGCSGDQFRISRTGDLQVTNAETYCGRQTLTGILSVGQRLVLALLATINSAGGRFRCTVVAQLVQQPQPCQCGTIKTSRIVGGNSTGLHEFNMMAGLIDRSTQTILCGAVIISNRYLLSAGHCVVGRTTASIIVSVGDSRLYSGQMFNVQTITIHPQYNPNNYDYDIAALGLSSLLTFSDFVGPICLPYRFGNADPAGVNVYLLGFGTLFFGGPTSSNLQKVMVPIISQSECRRSQPGVTNQQICTLSPGKDACQNDSGGPGIYFDPSTNRAYLLLIVSNGVGCGMNSPGINTRVQNFTTWIANNAPASYCVVP